MVERPDAAAWRLCDPRMIMAGLLALGLVPLLATPVLPLIDFYNHLARFFVLAHIGSSSLLQDYYQARWSLLPDIGVDVLATPLLRFIPPLIAGKIIVGGILALLYGGVLYFHRALTGQRSILVAVLLLPLLYSYILNWGFANFLLGLGLAFWAAGWWLDHRARPFLAVPVSCGWALLVFFSHGIAFAMYGILVACLEIGLFLDMSGRKPYDLFRALSLVAIQVFIPAAFFLSWTMGYADGKAVAALGNIPLPPFSICFADAIVYHLESILRVEESPFLWLDAATFAIQLGAVSFLIWRGRMIVARPARFLVAVVMLLAAIPLPALFGVGYIAERMPLFAALCLLGSLCVSPVAWTRESRAVCALLIAAVFVRLIAIAASWHGYNQGYREFGAIAARIPPGSLTMPVMVGSGHHETKVPRCEMYGPLLIAQFGQIGPLFSDEKQQPLRLIGPLKRADDALQKGAAIPRDDYNRQMTAAASAGFDYLLVCNTQLLKQPFPPGLEKIAATPRFALLRAVR